MDYFNKLKSAVSTATQYLPGNPVTREFEVLKQIGSAGPGLIWKIYASVKRSTKQPVAVFLLEKKLLDRFSRSDRDLILDSCRKGVSQLTKLRHPRLLTIQHPLEESRESLAFATEPVFASLANVLGNHDNIATPLPAELKQFKLYEVEIKYGLYQLAEGLAFLHNDLKMMHNNICLESVIINSTGAWKIAGFEFCLTSSSPQDQEPTYSFTEYENGIASLAQPSLDYLGPEFCLTMTCDRASDMFSLGMLSYAVFNNGKPLYENCNAYSTYRKNCEKLKSLSVSSLVCIPTEAREHIKMLLNVTPAVRPDADQFSKIPFFEDVGAMTLQYLDTLFQRDNLQKSQFFKGLPQILSKLPKRVKHQRVLTCLVKEFINPEMIPFVLPNVLLIAEDSTSAEYVELILPELKPVFKVTEPVQVLLIFMQKMSLLLSKTPPDDIRNHVLPMVYRALESDTAQIQELCLSIIPTFANMIDYPSMKNHLLPRLKKICLDSTSLSTRVNAVVCIGKLLEHFDKWLVLDEVLPILPQIPSREPAVLMGILGIYKQTLTHKKLGMTKEIMAVKVLPFLFTICIDNNLSLNQFNSFMSLIKDMVNRVEAEHRTKLEQLNQMQLEQKTSLEFSQNLSQTNEPGNLIAGIEKKPETSMEQIFSGFGLGNFLEPKPVTEVMRSSSPDGSQTSDVSPSLTRKEPEKNAKPVSLTMEEKQRLAKEQENMQRYKTQKPIKALTPSTNAAPQSKKTSMRDLTGTLGSNMNPPAPQNKSSISEPVQSFSTNMRPGVSQQPTFGTTNNSSAFSSTSIGSKGSSSHNPSYNASAVNTAYGVPPMGNTTSSMNSLSHVASTVSSGTNFITNSKFQSAGDGSGFGISLNNVGAYPQSSLQQSSFQSSNFNNDGFSNFQQAPVLSHTRPAMNPTSTQPKNMAALDNLFGPPKRSLPMNQMQSPPSQGMGSTVASGVNMQSYQMNTSFQGVVSNQSQAFNPQSMMGNQTMGIMQPQKTLQSPSQDISDIFG